MPDLQKSQRMLLRSNAADAAGRNLGDFTVELLFISTLAADAFDMGLLNALGTLAFVAATLPAGYLVDRLGPLRVLRLGLGAKVALTGCLLILSAAGALSVALGLVLATLLGFCNVFSETSQAAAAPALADDRTSMARLIARLAAADQALSIIIPAAAGTLFALLGAPPLLAAAAALLLAAFGTSCAVRGKTATRPTETEAGRSASRQGAFAAGLRYVWDSPVLKALTLSVAFSNLGLAIGSAVEGLFIINELGLGAAGFGLYAALGGLSGLAGALLAPRLAEKFTPRELALPTIAGQIVLSGVVLSAGFAAPPLAIILLVVHAAGWGVLILVFNVSMATWVAEITPEQLLGRVTSARRLFTFGVVPLGGLLGGGIGAVFGIRAALGAWVLANVLGLVCYLSLAMAGRRAQDPSVDEEVPEP